MKLSPAQWAALQAFIIHNDSETKRSEAERLLVSDPNGNKANAVEAIVRTLNSLPGVYTTRELAAMLPDYEIKLVEHAADLPPGYATHDGPTFKKYGRVFRSWRWHGQNRS